MITTTISRKQPTTKAQTYPYIGATLSLVVLFVAPNKGTVLHNFNDAEIDVYPVGTYMESWFEANFEEYKHVVSLQND